MLATAISSPRGREASSLAGHFLMPASSNILVVVAHPDDETFVSGTICLCVDRGFKVTIVCVTDGEGDSNDAPAQFAAMRRREASSSAHMLGAGQVVFLGYADIFDPEAQRANDWDQPSLIANLAKLIEALHPDLILTHGPGGGYGHHAHKKVWRCVMAAVEGIAYSGSVFSFCGQVKGAFLSWQFDEPSNILIDARDFVDRRSASIAQHKSQADYFLKPRLPRSLRAVLSAIFGYAFAFTEAGRKRIPIGTVERYVRRFPTEGLVLQKAPGSGIPHFFEAHFADDHRVRIL